MGEGLEMPPHILGLATPETMEGHVVVGQGVGLNPECVIMTTSPAGMDTTDTLNRKA